MILTVSSAFAKDYTAEDWQKEMINKITEFIRQNLTSIHEELDQSPSSSKSQSLRILDYACGPGTITAAIENHEAECIGIDLSENMVKTYNSRFSSNEEFDLKANAFVGNLLEDSITPSLMEPKFFDFDLVAVGLGFHHFEHPEFAAKQLCKRNQEEFSSSLTSSRT
jgi:2-polyprenyl-3-methyl-5-hydroxy-6-metoxy-1,4-benzoquinol methylase